MAAYQPGKLEALLPANRLGVEMDLSKFIVLSLESIHSVSLIAVFLLLTHLTLHHLPLLIYRSHHPSRPLFIHS